MLARVTLSILVAVTLLVDQYVDGNQKIVQISEDGSDNESCCAFGSCYLQLPVVTHCYLYLPTVTCSYPLLPVLPTVVNAVMIRKIVCKYR